MARDAEAEISVTGSATANTVLPRISVCIPAYNHAKYISACIESVLNQSISDFEILVTDDGSTDGTADVVKSFSDPRIRLFRLARNQGPSVAANNNFRKARGEFICPLASDDLFHPEKLERQLGFLSSHPDVGVAFSYMRYVDEAGSEIPDHPGYKWFEVENCPREIWLRRFFLVGNNLSAPTAMIRKGVLDRIGLTDPRLLQTQDLDLWIRVCLQFEVHVIPERLIDYRIRDNEQNTSTNTPFKQAQVYWELAKVFETYAAIDDPEFFERIFPESARPEYANWPIKAKLAMIAIKSQPRYVRAFGLELMYRLLGDEEVVQVISDNGFDFPLFFRAVGDVDVFGFGEQSFWKQKYDRSLDAKIKGMIRRLIK